MVFIEGIVGVLRFMRMLLDVGVIGESDLEQMVVVVQ